MIVSSILYHWREKFCCISYWDQLLCFFLCHIIKRFLSRFIKQGRLSMKKLSRDCECSSNSPALSWDGRTEASDKNVLMITYIYDRQVNRNLPLSVPNGWWHSWCYALLVHLNHYVFKARFSLLSYFDYRILWSSVKMY